jgi:hypothetical protein
MGPGFLLKRGGFLLSLLTISGAHALSISEFFRIHNLYEGEKDSFLVSCKADNSTYFPFYGKRFFINPLQPRLAIELGSQGEVLDLEFRFAEPSASNFLGLEVAYREVQAGKTVNGGLFISSYGSGQLQPFTYPLPTGGTLTCEFQGGDSGAVKLAPNLDGWAHFNIHPHSLYDGRGNLRDLVEPLLNRPHVNSHVILDALKLPFSQLNHINKSAGYSKIFDPRSDVALSTLGRAQIHFAGEGEFRVLPPAKDAPTKFLMTGGYFQFCLRRAIESIINGYTNHSARELDFVLYTPAINVSGALVDGETTTLYEVLKMDHDQREKWLSYFRLALGRASGELQDWDIELIYPTHSYQPPCDSSLSKRKTARIWFYDYLPPSF